MGAFESWVEAHWVRLRAVARVVCGDHDLAEDALQDALIEVYSRWDKISTGTNPFGYTVRVIVTKAATRRRSSWAKRVVLVDDVRSLERPARSEADAVVDHVAVARALQHLNPHQRAAIALHYFADSSVAEIAEMLDRPQGTVTSDLTRARSTLRDYLGGGEGNG